MKWYVWVENYMVVVGRRGWKGVGMACKVKKRAFKV
jgi:hypothetical protein